MDLTKFKITEQQYQELRNNLDSGLISPEEMKTELKKMMVQDEKGNYWMIGGKTGKWYIYNGNKWDEKNPYGEEDINIEYGLPKNEDEKKSEEALGENPAFEKESKAILASWGRQIGARQDVREYRNFKERFSRSRPGPVLYRRKKNDELYKNH